MRQGDEDRAFNLTDVKISFPQYISFFISVKGVVFTPPNEIATAFSMSLKLVKAWVMKFALQISVFFSFCLDTKRHLTPSVQMNLSHSVMISNGVREIGCYISSVLKLNERTLSMS